jgi:hypothetical protein
VVRQKPSLTDTPGRTPSLHPEPGRKPFGPSGLGELPIALLLLLEDKRKVTKQDALDEDVLDRGEFTKRMVALAAALTVILRRQEGAAANRVARLLDRDWARMSARERGRVLRQAAGELAQVPKGVEERLRQRAQAAALVMDRRAREAGRRRNNLDVSRQPSSSQTAQAGRLARPTPEFIVEEYERRGRVFAATAAIALGVGLGRGESATDITERIQGRATAALGRPAYLQGVAGAVLNRARTNSLLNVYREAGTTNIQVLSARDQRTCEKCLFMHGTIFPVEQTFDLMGQVARLRSPAAIAEVNPFLREGVSANGDRVVYVPGPNGARLTLGTVLESRQGQVDRLSTFDRTPNPIELLSLGIGLPPYHPICRCVPVIA